MTFPSYYWMIASDVLNLHTETTGARLQSPENTMTTYLSFVLLIVLVCAGGADAQESRADTLKQAREEKQQAVDAVRAGHARNHAQGHRERRRAAHHP